MKAPLLAVAAVLSASLAVVRADRASEQGLIGSLFAPTQSYAPINLEPPRLPALHAPAPSIVQAAQTAPVAAVAAAALPIETFAAAPELASAGPDELVAFGGPSAPSAAAPVEQAVAQNAENPRLQRINVLDSDSPAATAPRGEMEMHASVDNAQPCGDACGGPSIAASPFHAGVNSPTANVDLRWRKLPCSRPGAYRYQVVNNSRHRYTSVVLYDGEQRWQVGTLEPGQRVVISSDQPLGPNPGVDHDPIFVSAWDL